MPSATKSIGGTFSEWSRFSRLAYETCFSVVCMALAARATERVAVDVVRPAPRRSAAWVIDAGGFAGIPVKIQCAAENYGQLKMAGVHEAPRL